MRRTSVGRTRRAAAHAAARQPRWPAPRLASAASASCDSVRRQRRRLELEPSMPAHRRSREPLRLQLGQQARATSSDGLPISWSAASAANRLRFWMARANRPDTEPWLVIAEPAGGGAYLARRSKAGRRPKTAANAAANPAAATVRPAYFPSMSLVSAATASPMRALLAAEIRSREANAADAGFGHVRIADEPTDRRRGEPGSLGRGIDATLPKRREPRRRVL
jgi:hypothetical protein